MFSIATLFARLFKQRSMVAGFGPLSAPIVGSVKKLEPKANAEASGTKIGDTKE